MDDHDFVLRVQPVSTTLSYEKTADDYALYKIQPHLIYSGYVMKRGDLVRSIWYRYYLCLSFDAIYCFIVQGSDTCETGVEHKQNEPTKNENQKIPLTSVPNYIIPFEAINKPIVSSALGPSCFQISTDDQIFYFRSTTKSESIFWVNILNSFRIRVCWMKHLRRLSDTEAETIGSCFKLRSISESGDEIVLVRSTEEINSFNEKLKMYFRKGEFIDAPILSDQSDAMKKRYCILLADYYTDLLNQSLPEVSRAVQQFICDVDSEYFEKKSFVVNSSRDSVRQSFIAERELLCAKDHERVILLAMSPILNVKRRVDPTFGIFPDRKFEVDYTGSKLVVVTQQPSNESSIPFSSVSIYDNEKQLSFLKPISTFQLSGTVRAANFSPDGSYVSLTCFIPVLPSMDIKPFKPLQPLEELHGAGNLSLPGYLQVFIYRIKGFSHFPDDIPTPGSAFTDLVLTLSSQPMIVKEKLDCTVFNNFIDFSFRKTRRKEFDGNMKGECFMALLLSSNIVAIWNMETKTIQNWIDISTLSSGKSCPSSENVNSLMGFLRNPMPATSAASFPKLKFHPDVNSSILCISALQCGTVLWDYQSNDIIWNNNQQTTGFAFSLFYENDQGVSTPNESTPCLKLVDVSAESSKKIKIKCWETRNLKKYGKKLSLSEPGIWNEGEDPNNIPDSWRVKDEPLLAYHPCRDQILVVSKQGKVILWNFADDILDETNVTSTVGLFNEVLKVNALENFAISPLISKSKRNDGDSSSTLDTALHQSKYFVSIPDVQKTIAMIENFDAKSFSENINCIVSIPILNVTHAGYTKDGKFVWTFSPSEGIFALWSTENGQLAGECILSQNEVSSHQNQPPILVEELGCHSVLVISNDKVVERTIINTKGEISTHLIGGMKVTIASKEPFMKNERISGTSSPQQMNSVMCYFDPEVHFMKTSNDILEFVVKRIRSCQSTLKIAENQYSILDGIFRNDYNAVKKMLEAYHMDPNFESLSNNQIPLTLACRLGLSKMAQLLLNKGASISFCGNSAKLSPLHAAIVSGDIKTLQLILDQAECNVNVHWDISEHESGVFVSNYYIEGRSSSYTPLHVAAYGGHAEMIDIICKKGADVNALDSNNRTPLHYACASYDMHFNINTIELLILNGANVNLASISDSTPLHEAVFSDDCLKLVSLLIKAGAEPEGARDVYGDTPVDIYPEIFNHKKIVPYIRSDTLELIKHLVSKP